MRNNFPCFIPTVVTIILLTLFTVSSVSVALTHDFIVSSGEETAVSDSAEDDEQEVEETTVETSIETSAEVIFESEVETEVETAEPVETEEDAKDSTDVVTNNVNSAAPITTTANVVEAPVETGGLYDVPLSSDLQVYIFNQCEKRGIDPRIIIGIIQTESRFTADAVGDSGRSLGLMQIQPRWHTGRMTELGCSDLLNPYDNVTVGIDIFADLYDCSGSVEWALMAYNGGAGYADRMFSSGTLSDYVYKVLGVVGELRSYESIG